MNKISSEALLSGWLHQLADEELAELAKQPAPSQYAQRTPDCLSLPRFRRALLRGDWKPAEMAHKRGCAFCRRNEAAMQRTQWHPSLSQLVLHALDRLDGDAAKDLAYHLESDECRRCGRVLRSNWFQAAVAGARAAGNALESLLAALDGAVVGWQPLLPAAQFAGDQQPRLHVQATNDAEELTVTLRHADDGELIVHAETSRADCDGRGVHVEVVGTGDTVISDIVTLHAADDGCRGRLSFGPYVKIADRLERDCLVLATLADKSANASEEPATGTGSFSSGGVLVRVVRSGSHLTVRAAGGFSPT